MSENFATIDFEHVSCFLQHLGIQLNLCFTFQIKFPVHMRVDYIRVYQPKDAKNVGCDPEDFPTASYINQ